MENPELDRIAKRLAIQLGLRLEDAAAGRIIRDSLGLAMQPDTISPYALDQAVATVQPTRSEFETDMISPSVSGLEGRVTILEDQVSRLFEKLNTAAGILI